MEHLCYILYCFHDYLYTSIGRDLWTGHLLLWQLSVCTNHILVVQVD